LLAFRGRRRTRRRGRDEKCEREKGMCDTVAERIYESPVAIDEWTNRKGGENVKRVKE
jgi:hypothetical protein